MCGATNASAKWPSRFWWILSGSTSRQIDGRRVIDVEKEALVLLCEALEAIGDQYAIYGYSSRGRRHVDFVVLKDFDDPINRSSSRIGGMSRFNRIVTARPFGMRHKNYWTAMPRCDCSY